MLWFIKLPSCRSHLYRHLNTSYVMVHRQAFTRCFFTQRFKYILCYGSSTNYEMLAIVNQNLNTSYVMVHLVFTFKTDVVGVFKYILCYGSSQMVYTEDCQEYGFKYILCYGSSLYFKPFLKYDILILPVFKRLLQIFTNRLTIFLTLYKYCRKPYY